ncbi:MAG: hypothetical protein B7X40_00550 [Cellulomonas sp. 14-74-6]|nr:MAG: hypothetical protein B7X40_00550 [Cellulomonas sp. 14-74-6]
MIDFRYHLVSLISVFLALAVGIALGAGPLKQTLGDTLTGQVQQLRIEKAQLRSQLDDTAGQLKNSDAYLDAASGQLVQGTLKDRRVAVVALGPVPQDERTAVDARLTQAGATVSAHVTLTDAWSSTDQRSFRQGLVGYLLGYLSPAPDQGAGVQAQLAQALVQGLVRAESGKPDTLTQDSTVLLQLLSSGQTPLIALANPVTAPADAVVVLAVPVATTGAATPAPTPAQDATSSALAVVGAAQSFSHGAVLVDGSVAAGSLVSAVLADKSLSGAVTTVSGADTITGQVTVPLALAARIAGTNGHYGFGSGLSPMPARTAVPTTAGARTAG